MNLPHLVEKFSEAAWQTSLSAAVLAAFVAAVQFALRKQLRPAWRYWLWMPVVIRLLAPALPDSAFSLFNLPRWVGPKAAPPGFKVEITDAPVHRPVSETSAEFPIADAEALAIPAASAERRLNLRTWLGTIWAAGLILLLGRLALGSLWLRYHARRTAVPSSEEAVQLLAEVTAELKCWRRPALRESPLVSAPALFGIFAPTILLPTGFLARFSREELRQVFLHEAAHLKRGDLWMNALMAVAQAVHWFNPVVWLVCRRMRLERELACDEVVLRSQQGAGSAYGQTILRILQDFRPAPLPGGVGILEHKREARARMAQIANFNPTRRRATLLGAASLILIVTCGLTNAQRPSRPATAEPANPPKELPSDNLVANDPASDWTLPWSGRLSGRFSVQGLDFAQGVERLRQALPAELQAYQFVWTEPVRIGNGTNVYSVNAVGFITHPVAEAPAARSVRLQTPAGRSSSPTHIGEALTWLIEGADRRVQALISKGKVEFSPGISNGPPVQFQVVGGSLRPAELPLSHSDTNQSRETQRSAGPHFLDLIELNDFTIPLETRLPEVVQLLESAVNSDSSKPEVKFVSLSADMDSIEAQRFSRYVVNLPGRYSGPLRHALRRICDHATVPGDKAVQPLRFGFRPGDFVADPYVIFFTFEAVDSRSNPPADPNDIPSQRRYAVGTAKTLLAEGNPNEALTLLNKLIEEDPDNTIARYYRQRAIEALAATGPGNRSTNASYALSAARTAAVEPARRLINQNKLDEAIDLLDQILAADPENRPARYYQIIALEREASFRDRRIRDLDVPGAARPRTGRDRLAKRFDEIRLERFVVPPGTELSEAVRLLDQAVKAQAPNRLVNFLVSMSYESANPQEAANPARFTVELPGAVTDSLRGILNQICSHASAPQQKTGARLRYSVEDYAVVFHATAADEPLYTRTYNLHAQLLTAAVNAYVPSKEVQAKFPAGEGQNPTIQTKLAFQTKLARFFAEKAGLEFQPPPGAATPNDKTPPTKAIFFNERTGVLFVRASLAEMDRIERVIQRIDTPQVVIEARYYYIPTNRLDVALNTGARVQAAGPSGESAAGTNTLASAATANQVQPILEQLSRLPPDPIRKDLETITTAGGVLSEAQVKELASVYERRAAVAGTTVGLLTEPQGHEVIRHLETVLNCDVVSLPKVVTLSGRIAKVSLESNDSIEVQADWERAAKAIRLGAFATASGEGKGPVRLGGSGLVYDGQFLLLSGGVVESAGAARSSNRVPVLADIPIIGRLFPSPTAKEARQVVVLISACLIDDVGNRIYSSTNRPFDPNQIPPQP